MNRHDLAKIRHQARYRDDKNIQELIKFAEERMATHDEIAKETRMIRNEIINSMGEMMTNSWFFKKMAVLLPGKDLRVTGKTGTIYAIDIIVREEGSDDSAGY